MEGSLIDLVSSTQPEIIMESFSLPLPPSTTPLHSPQELEVLYNHCIAQSRKRQHDKISTSDFTYEKQGSIISNVDDVFLSRCPTLELQVTEAAPLIRQFLSQWSSDSQTRSQLKNELEGMNSDYLQNLYDTPEKKEADLFRRVDVERSRRILISNSETQIDSACGATVSEKSTREKKIVDCVSCLTQGQHQHYLNIVKYYMRNRRRPPPSTPSHPDTTVVLDLMEAEQACFLTKLKQETCGRVSYVQENRDGHPSHSVLDASHDCMNHNFLGGMGLHSFAQYHRIQSLSERVEGFLILAKMAVGIGSSSGPSYSTLSSAEKKAANGRRRVYFHSCESFLRYGRLVAAGHSVQFQLVLDSENEGQKGHLDAYKGILPLVISSRDVVGGERPIFLSDHCKAEEAEGTSNAVALPFALDVNLLMELASTVRHVEEEDTDFISSKNEISETVNPSGQFLKKNTPEEYWNNAVDSGYAYEKRIINPTSVVLVPKLPGMSAQGFSSCLKGISLALSFEAMLTLLTAHINRQGEGINSRQNGFRLPIIARVVMQAGKGCRTSAIADGASSTASTGSDKSFEVHLEMGNSFPRQKETCRGILVNAIKYLISYNKSISPFLQEMSENNSEGQSHSTGDTSGNANGGLAGSQQTSSHVLPNSKTSCCATLKLFRPDDDPGFSLLANSKELGADLFFTKPLYLNVVHHAVAFQGGVRPIFTMVKVDYLTKDPSLRPTTPSGQLPAPPQLRESFSIGEVLEMCLLFRCFPTAIVRVYYVNAYFSYIFGVTDFTRSTWEVALTMQQEKDSPFLLEDDFYATPAVTQSEDFQYAFDSLFDVLHAVCRSVVAALAEALHPQQLPQTSLPEAANFHYLLVKLNNPPQKANQEAMAGRHDKKHARSLQYAEEAHLSRKYDLSLYHVTELYPKFELQFNKMKEAESFAFVEEARPEVCEREYLPPDNWIYRDRIPFTFPPAKSS